MEPLGAVLHTCQFQVGDATLSTLELWGAEYQESNALLCRAEDVPRLLRARPPPPAGTAAPSLSSVTTRATVASSSAKRPTSRARTRSTCRSSRSSASLEFLLQMSRKK